MSERHEHDRGSLDDVLAVYRRDVDRGLLRENLALTPEERIRRLMKFLEGARRLREAGRNAT